MCSQETQKKIDNGTHIVVNKNKAWLLTIFNGLSPFAIFGALIWLGGWKAESEHKMFDSAEQKQEVIRHTNKGLTPVQADDILDHVEDPDIHMSTQEKRTMYIMEERQEKIIENQGKIGQDLEEIKNLIRYGNN